VFIGSEKVKIEDGRLCLPKQFRDEIDRLQKNSSEQDSKPLYFGVAFDLPAIRIYTEKEWRKLYDIIAPLDETHTGEVGRLFWEYSSQFAIKTQGRIEIPERLTDYAEISESCIEALVIGCGLFIEIWNPSIRDKHIKNVRSNEEYKESGLLKKLRELKFENGI